MIPVLYSATETEFNTNGLGALYDATSCEVSQELNGIYELTMKYPIKGLHFSELARRVIIKAKPDTVTDPQPFRVYRITKPLNGIVTVYARHLVYDTAGIPVSPFSATGAPAALQGLKNNAAIACPFTFETEKAGGGTMTVAAPASLWSKLGGSEGSVLDVFGGEYSYDAYRVTLHKRRGADNGVAIRYGKNLTDLEQDENCANCYTGVYPYWSVENELVTLPEKILHAEGNFGYIKILPLDMTERFEEKPTEEELRSAAAKYMVDNEIGVPAVSWKVEFVSLEQTEEYKGQGFLERISLGDTVLVVFDELGVNASSRAVKTVYNVLCDRYENITLGRVKSNLAQTIVDQNKEIAKRPSKTLVEKISDALASAIMGAAGGAVRHLDTDNDGYPDTLYIADHPDPAQAVKVWRFNYEGWAASKNGYNGPFVMGATLEDGILANAITAANLVAGTIKSADGKTFFLDLDNGVLRMRASELSISGQTVDEIAQGKANAAQNAATAAAAADATAKANAAQAAAQAAAKAELNSYADTVTKNISNLQSQIDGNITTWFDSYIPTTSNGPANSWTTTALKNQHLGDLFYIVNNSSYGGRVYRWTVSGSTYSWQLVEDTDVTKALAAAAAAQDTADGKRRVFIATPAPPYDKGDLWTNGADLLVCKVARLSGSYLASDWGLATDYIDEAVAEQKANAAQAAATSAAAADATTKANAAQAAAIAAAAADATAKANAAQAAATSAAEAAINAALATASADASGKAGNAESNAKAYADLINKALNQLEIFNRLTGNGAAKGIYYQDGQLYINATYLKSGTISSDLINTLTLFAKHITMTGTFVNTTNAFLEPNEVVRETIVNHLLGVKTIPGDKISLYDFNGDGEISGADLVQCQAAILGNRPLWGNFARAVKTPVTCTIDLSNPSKALTMSGTDMWGNYRESVIGVDPGTATFVNKDAFAAIVNMNTYGEMYREIDGEKEYFNPYTGYEDSPVEFRTTERWDNQPVYLRFVRYEYTGTLGNGSGVTDIQIPHGIAGWGEFYKVVRVNANVNRDAVLPFIASGGGMTVVNGVDSTNIKLRIRNDTWRNPVFYFEIYYVKEHFTL